MSARQRENGGDYGGGGIITINFLNIHLDYASIFFFGRVEGEGWGGGGVIERKLGLLKACWLNGTIK